MGVIAYARAQKQVVYNIQMLVGDEVHGYNPGTDNTQKQHVKHQMQDWYRVRWLSTSDCRAVFPVVGDAAFFRQTTLIMGCAPKCCRRFSMDTAQLVSDSLAGNKAPAVPGSLLAQFAMRGQKADLEKEAISGPRTVCMRLRRGSRTP